MCQAYEAEAAGIRSMEDLQTKEGWRAHMNGQDIDEAPIYLFTLGREAWEHGWVCRNQSVVEGRILIPWAIKSMFRAERRRKGLDEYVEPTLEDADRLV